MASTLAMPTLEQPENSSRLELLRNAPKNSWVALSADETRIVAIGATFLEADIIAKKSGAQNYMLTRTPDAWISRVLSPTS